MTAWTVDALMAHLGPFELGPVDLRLAPGRTVAVLGRSGAGKTTLLRTIAGFVLPRSGRLTRAGVDVTRTAPEQRSIGYVPQGLGLFPHRTVERNVSFPLELRGRLDARPRSRELLARFGLTDLAKRYPAQLSGGEAQRVALARALAASPDLLLWDEPWQALDVEARHALAELLSELQATAPVPVLLVTHEPSLAFGLADEFLVLARGRPRFQGRPAELLARPVDGFTARFVGFENLFAPSALAGGGAGSLAAWLRDRSDGGDVAFPRPVLAGSGPWEGTVRAARPSPEGASVTVACGPLTVELRAPSSLGTPAVGARVRFDVDGPSVHALPPPPEAEAAG